MECFDIVVVGNGFVGCIVVIVFLRLGYFVVFIGFLLENQDGCMMVLMDQFIVFLEGFGVWDKFGLKFVVFKIMQIIDGIDWFFCVLIVFFCVFEIGFDVFGYNFFNMVVFDVFGDIIGQDSNIYMIDGWIMGVELCEDVMFIFLEDGGEIEVGFVVVVDGCKFVLCEVVGIVVCCWFYLQIVVVLNFVYMILYGNVLIEFYMLIGLFMQVFLLGQCFSFVWVQVLVEVEVFLVFFFEEISCWIERCM